MIGWMEWPKL
jgi:hypothetical protein